MRIPRFREAQGLTMGKWWEWVSHLDMPDRRATRPPMPCYPKIAPYTSTKAQSPRISQLDPLMDPHPHPPKYTCILVSIGSRCVVECHLVVIYKNALGRSLFSRPSSQEECGCPGRVEEVALKVRVKVIKGLHKGYLSWVEGHYKILNSIAKWWSSSNFGSH